VGQKSYYSGHKGYHRIIFQSIVTPDGLISSVYGPELAPKGDWKLWQESGILQETFTDSEDVLYLYRDPAYAPSYGIIAPYRATVTHASTPNEQALNLKISSY